MIPFRSMYRYQLAEELFASIIKVVPRAALKDEAASSLK
jgi:hypothetical protein